MATYWAPRPTPPQPGDGTFLLHADTSRARRKNKPKNKMKIAAAPQLSRFSRAREAGGVIGMPEPDLCPPSTMTATPLAGHDSTEPRTIDHENLFSAAAVSTAKSPAHTPSFFLSLVDQPTPSPNYAAIQPGSAHSAMDEILMTRKPKIIPPHQRPKKHPQPQADIVEKLSNVGVHVSKPKPASKEEVSALANEKTASLGSPQSVAPLYSVRGSVSARDKPRGGRRGRGNRGGGGRNKSRNNGWPTKADFPTLDPKRWQTKWDNSPDSDDSSIPPDWVENCRSEKMMRGDEYLTGNYDGKIAPAPLDWDNRPAFRPHQSASGITKWLSQIYSRDETRGEKWIIPTHTVRNEKADILYSFATFDDPPDGVVVKFMGDLVPQYWMPTVIENQSPQQFWIQHLRNTSPEPVDPEDLQGAQPWWELKFKGGSFMEMIPQPKCNGVDPTLENGDQKSRRELDSGSWNAAEDRRKFELLKIENRQARLKKKAKRAERIKARLKSNHRCQNLPVKDAVNVYIAVAKQDDMKDVTDIYNHYVENSCITPETERLTTEEMSQRFRDSKNSSLPFLIAIERGELIKASRKEQNQRVQQEDVQLPDKIVGFACADDYSDKTSIFRYAATAQVFVKPDSLMKGIASCLMDKLLAMMDPDYLERGGYDTESQLEGVSPQRAIKNIMVNFHYEQQKPERLEWMARWLETTFGFRQGLVDEELGAKLGKAVNVARFRRVTGLVFNYANPPLILYSSPEPA